MLGSGSSTSIDYIAKVLIIGDSAVGKTSLLLRYCDGKFTGTTVSTIGVDYKIKTFEIDGKRLKLKIWDTAGQEKFRNITESYYKGSAGVILTYACNDRKSFENVGSWVKQITARSGDKICKILVASKCDTKDRVVTLEEGQQLADSYGIKFFETSAKEDLNVKELFSTMAKDVKNYCTNFESVLLRSTLQPDTEISKPKCC